MVGNDGVMTCLNAISSDLMGQKRYGGKFSASPVLADGKMYFFSEEGRGPSDRSRAGIQTRRR